MAQATSGHLEGFLRSPGRGAHRKTLDDAGQAQGTGLRTDPVGIAVGLGAAQAMVRMSHGQFPRELPPQSGQGVQQHHGIQASRHRDHQVAGLAPEPFGPIPAELL